MRTILDAGRAPPNPRGEAGAIPECPFPQGPGVAWPAITV
jgi:hypothetical protein